MGQFFFFPSYLRSSTRGGGCVEGRLILFADMTLLLLPCYFQKLEIDRYSIASDEEGLRLRKSLPHP
jgi:hypothetical protein